MIILLTFGGVTMQKWRISIIVAACVMATLWNHAEAQPPTKGRHYYEARGEIVWEVPTDEKIIALTFDDGPDPADTPAILDLLRQYEAKATFFLSLANVLKSILS